MFSCISVHVYRIIVECRRFVSGVGMEFSVDTFVSLKVKDAKERFRSKPLNSRISSVTGPYSAIDPYVKSFSPPEFSQP